MNRGIEKLKQAWNENPVQVLFVGAMVATAASKLLNSYTAHQNAQAWQREVDRRIMMKAK